MNESQSEPTLLKATALSERSRASAPLTGNAM